MTGLKYDKFYAAQTLIVLDGSPTHPCHWRLQFSEPKKLEGTDKCIDPVPKDGDRAPGPTPL